MARRPRRRLRDVAQRPRARTPRPRSSRRPRTPTRREEFAREAAARAAARTRRRRRSPSARTATSSTRSTPPTTTRSRSSTTTRSSAPSEAVKAAIDAARGRGARRRRRVQEGARPGRATTALGFAYVRLSQLFSCARAAGRRAAAAARAGRRHDRVRARRRRGRDQRRDRGARRRGRGRAERPGRGARRRCPATRGWRPASADVGAAVRAARSSSSRQLGALGGVDVEQVLEQFEQPDRLRPARGPRCAGWATPACSCRARRSADIGGALVVESKDPAKSEAFVGDLAAR